MSPAGPGFSQAAVLVSAAVPLGEVPPAPGGAACPQQGDEGCAGAPACWALPWARDAWGPGTPSRTGEGGPPPPRKPPSLAIKAKPGFVLFCFVSKPGQGTDKGQHLWLRRQPPRLASPGVFRESCCLPDRPFLSSIWQEPPPPAPAASTTAAHSQSATQKAETWCPWPPALTRVGRPRSPARPAASPLRRVQAGLQDPEEGNKGRKPVSVFMCCCFFFFFFNRELG